MINFNCTSCGKAYSVADNLAGRKAKCKTCGTSVVVPEPAKGGLTSNDVANWLDEDEAPAVATSEQAAPPAAAKTTRSGVAPAAKKKPPVRTRRLIADANMLVSAFKGFPPIRIRKREGDPPDHYEIVYNVRGLVRGPEGKPIYREAHVVEIQLTRDYPRQSPKCRMLTPIFHPNIEPSTICVGDHWTAGERLVDLVIRIGEMIAWQAYNIKSPLDGDAAMWADQNPQYLPVDTRDLRPPNIE